MLISAIHEEESRVAIIEDGYLHELDIESAHKALTKSNIYRGKITKVEGSLQAAFVEYGSARQGFLPVGEIHPDYWKEGVDKSLNPRNLSIQDILQAKQEILVQVVKEERGNKGAALTTNISLAGRYLVLSPNTVRGGISRKLSDEDRRSMKEILKQLDVPDDMGLIIRTAGKDQTLEALQRDYQYLRRLWDEIRITSETTPSPALIYLDGDLATRAIRDHFSDDIQEIWVDNHEVYTRTKAFVHAVIPGKEKLVKLYRGKKPLFRLHNIEQQCEETHQREIRLPTGGSIVLDPTEALTAIDINSASATKGKHIDDTALAINLEAAEEIARQLRIRDIGGLIVIDFIDMANRKHGQQVEDLLRKACKGDKARIQFARISRFGLLEMSRQRLHPSVRESTTEGCPRCQGRGSIRTVDSMALQMLTRMEDWSERGKQPTLIVQVPSETGEYLMNNKRANIARIEEAYDIQITLQIRPDLDIPHYRIERQWNENNQQRVEVLEDTGKRIKPPRPNRKLKPVKPVVGIPTPVPEQAPAVEPKKEGPLQSLINLFIGARKKTPPKAPETEETKKTEQPSNQRPRRRNRNRGNTQNKKASSATEDNKQQTNTKAQKQPKKATHKKSEKPKSNPAEDNKAKEQELSSSNNETDTTASKPRRRRRRRRRSAGNSDAANAAQNSASVDSNNKPQAPSTATASEKRDNAPAAKSAPAKADNAPAAKSTPAK
ncbi:Rne/Rng family ribonuclease, partial [Mariprofundus sp. EBB-1]